MPNRLQPLNLMDFTGGINLRRNQFQLAENESPDMLNVDIDPRGGFYTRRGWRRWNDDDVVDPSVVIWKPRNAFVHTLANGDPVVYVVNAGSIFFAGTDGVFTQLAGVTAAALPHQADFVSWGDTVYIACGMFNPTRRRTGTTLTTMDPDNWSEVETPVHDTVPRAEYMAAHASYLFVAVTNETDGNHFARVRWSHPNKPDSFRDTDFLDIDSGGGRITGIMSFRDHLLIFKTNSLWALYGYDEDSWQLIKVSISVGCPSITAATRSETAVYFFSASDKGGIYAYNGENPIYLSENLRTAFEEILAVENVFVSWAGRRLWVGVPWIKGKGANPDLSTIFVFDPDIGEGAWTMYRSDYGAIGPIIDGSDTSGRYPLAAFWSTWAAILVTVDDIDEAYDMLLEPVVLGATPPPQPDAAYVMTSAGQEISIEGSHFRGQEFISYYRTRWLHAGWPDRKKSWRRPTLVCRQVDIATDLLVETYRDYDETTIHRSRILRVPAEGAAYWREDGFDAGEGGFDWKVNGEASVDGRGADWSSQRAGSNIIRAGSMGLARSVQMRVRASPNTPLQKWGVDGIVAKYIPRRFR